MIIPMMFSTVGLVPGQQQWITAGTFNFVVPDYCYEIAGVGIGSGASGATGASGDTSTSGAGGGGALTYDNDIAVTPGETLTVVVGAPGAKVNVDNSNGNNGAACQIKRGATVLLDSNGGSRGLNTQIGGNGGVASAPAGGVSWAGGAGRNGATASRAYGGTSGRYTSAGVTGSHGNVGGGLGLCASLFGDDTGTDIGRGSDGVRQNAQSTAGYTGGVRIMWGPGRSFPSNAADV